MLIYVHRGILGIYRTVASLKYKKVHENNVTISAETIEQRLNDETLLSVSNRK